MAGTYNILFFFLFGLCQAEDVSFVLVLGDLGILIRMNRVFAIAIIVELVFSCCVCLCDLKNGSCGSHTVACTCVTCLTVIAFLIVFIIGNSDSLSDIADARLDLVGAIIGVTVGACCACCCCLLALGACLESVEHTVTFDFEEMKEVASSQRLVTSRDSEESTSYMAMAMRTGGQSIGEEKEGVTTLQVREGRMYWSSGCSNLPGTTWQLVTTPLSPVVACAASAFVIYAVTKDGKLFQTRDSLSPGNAAAAGTPQPQWVHVPVPVGIKAIAAAGGEVWAVSADSKLYKSQEPLEDWSLVADAAGIAAIAIGPAFIYALRGKQGTAGQLVRTPRSAPAGAWEECQVPHSLRAISTCRDSLYGIWEDVRCKCQPTGPPGPEAAVLVQQKVPPVQIGNTPGQKAAVTQPVTQQGSQVGLGWPGAPPVQIGNTLEQAAPDMPASVPAEAGNDPLGEVTQSVTQQGSELGLGCNPRAGCTQPEVPRFMSL